MNAWMRKTDLNLQENSFITPSQTLCRLGEQHSSDTNCWDHSIAPSSTLPGKPGLLHNTNIGRLGQEDYAQAHISSLGVAGPVSQTYTTGESIPDIDQQFSQPRHEIEPPYCASSAIRRSESSISLSVPDNFFHIPVTYGSDDVSTHLFSVAPARLTPQSVSSQMQASSRGCVFPSLRSSIRSAPYSTDGFLNTTRWSLGSRNDVESRHSSSSGYENVPELSIPFQKYFMQAPVSSVMTPGMPHDIVSGPESTMSMPLSYLPSLAMGGCRDSALMAPARKDHTLPTSRCMRHYTSHLRLSQPPPLASYGLPQLLPNNIESQPPNSQYEGLSESTDLYLALYKEPAPPPQEDMNPSDPGLMPYEQELRFDGDMHTPKWVRGHGTKREGWCGVCKPGRWLVLKNSAYWYDKAFTHGIPATGEPFQEPLDKRRTDGSPNVWEGLCGSCYKWVALVSREKKGTKWFRHAYKCHPQAKVKDTPKRRRDQAHNSCIPGPSLSSVGIAGIYEQRQRPDAPPPMLCHGVATASYVTTAGGDDISLPIPQYTHPQQQHPQHYHQALGPSMPPLFPCNLASAAHCYRAAP